MLRVPCGSLLYPGYIRYTIVSIAQLLIIFNHQRGYTFGEYGMVEGNARLYPINLHRRAMSDFVYLLPEFRQDFDRLKDKFLCRRWLPCTACLPGRPLSYTFKTPFYALQPIHPSYGI
jgi:hypothetical protein